MDAGLDDIGFWAALAASLLIAGAAAYPVNRWLISRGKGHAVVHQHHLTGSAARGSSGTSGSLAPCRRAPTAFSERRYSITSSVIRSPGSSTGMPGG